MLKTRELTFDVEGVVDDKFSIPHHRQIHWQVADVIALVRILQSRQKKIIYFTLKVYKI